MPTKKLKTYHQKRNFSQTPEPRGKTKASKSKRIYIIQQHAASHLHYDFRLEIDGVLKSWAVPKGPSLDPSVKRLAVHVEDHPIEYGSFEGTIPQGEYGGGTVMLWDKGFWDSNSSLAEAYRKGDMTFTLHGEKLQGLWKLIRIKKTPKNWLLMKLLDSFAHREKDLDITQAAPLSAVSGRSMQEIAANAANVWHSNKKTKTSKKLPLIKVSSLTGAKKRKIPSVIHPELATLVDQPPQGELWLHEVKFDGYRLLIFINNKVRAFTRNQNDWTEKVPALIAAFKRLNLGKAIFDGELIALDEHQHSDFQILQNTLHTAQPAPLIYYVFDILYYDGYDLTQTPLLERKQFLKQLIPQDPTIQYSDHVIGNGEKVFNKACQIGLEGIISKLAQSLYLEKRTQEWLKVKCVQRQEFVIGGFTKPKGSRRYFGSLLIGVFKKDKTFEYCGHVGTGFNEATLHSLYTLLQKNLSQKMPFSEKPPAVKDVQWVKPTIVVEVEFLQRTNEGILRHPSFKGLRKDKAAKKVIMEIPKPIEKIEAPIMKNTVNKEDFKFTNPERVFYPEARITKSDLGEYYRKISKHILPFLIHRPLTLVRCPEGYNKECFYQKHLKERLPGVFFIDIQEKKKTEKYIYIEDLTGLMSLVQIGVLEIHPWGCKIDAVERPDTLVFDLDPGPGVTWGKVIKTAKYLRAQLAKLKLKSFVKTSGGKGLHIVVPIKPVLTWSEVIEFAKAFTHLVVEQNPKDYVDNMSKAKRKGKIFIDYLRNNRGSTTVGAYSTRARTGAPVSTPISWDELSTKIKANTYNIFNVPKRLSKLKKDPWAGYLRLKQILPGFG